MADETVEMEDGIATTTFVVTDEEFTIKASYPNVESEFIGTAKPSQPQVITLNDGNWTYYFREDGRVNMNITPQTVLNSSQSMLVLGNEKVIQKCFHI